MTSALDQKGLDAAALAYERQHRNTCYPDALDGEALIAAEAIVRAYLSTVIPTEIARVVDTLRSMSHDDNTRACVSVNITVSNDLAKKLFDVLHAAPKAATALEAQAAELAEVRQQYVDANEARIDAEARLAEANKALDAVKAENVKLRHIADEQIRAEFAARQALKHLQASDDWYYQNRPIVEIAKEASGFEEALEVIAGSHWERVGYCQSDVEDVPDLTAVEAQSHARATLQRFRAARRVREGGKVDG